MNLNTNEKYLYNYRSWIKYNLKYKINSQHSGTMIVHISHEMASGILIFTLHPELFYPWNNGLRSMSMQNSLLFFYSNRIFIVFHRLSKDFVQLQRLAKTVQ